MSEAQKQADQELNENLDTPEAIAAEETVLKETTQEEIKKELIDKYQLDETENEDLINTLVTDKLEERKRLSTAIKQKRSWRDKAKSPTKEPEEKKPETPANINEIIAAQVREQLDKGVLEKESLSDELKDEVKSYAKLKGITLSKALESEYIKFQIGESDKKAREAGASISPKANRHQSTRDFSQASPADFDVSTEEGQKQHAEYKEWLKRQ